MASRSRVLEVASGRAERPTKQADTFFLIISCKFHLFFLYLPQLIDLTRLIVHAIIGAFGWHSSIKLSDSNVTFCISALPRDVPLNLCQKVRHNHAYQLICLYKKLRP